MSIEHTDSGSKPLAATAAVVLVAALAGCQTNPSNTHGATDDNMLTPERWAARTPDQAVVVMGGSSGIWYKADEPDYEFRNRPRYTVNLREGYDVVLLKPGRYELRTVVLSGGGPADFGGVRGLGQSASRSYAGFTARPGEVVYVGDFLTQIREENVALCIAGMSVRDNTEAVASNLQVRMPYMTGKPLSTSLIEIEQDDIRFPPPCF